ncbi:uncharacterized protein LOC121410942 isoform X2 [Lytechinus variegatus]|nr:uncharacterized protein LOC121410942 isoform X2 [Lytechinus variegatus]
MATQSELAQIQHILGKRRNLDQNPLDLSSRKKSREYLDSHKDVEKRRRDRINTCLDTIRSLVPLCHQLPRHRRVDKADLLDLAIIYLRMVNQFLEKLGINDIFSAAHQQVSLFTSLEKWVKDHGEKSQDVTSFTKEILGFLQGEVETASHVIASQQTAQISHPGSENGFQQNSDWMKNEQSGLDDDPSGPRSVMTSSGSDEEKSQGSYRENRSSGSEDSVGVASPSNLASFRGTDFQRKCRELPSRYAGEKKDNIGHEKSSTGSRYNSLVSYSNPYVEYVDKAVNTDATSSKFTWPPDNTFTLPILSGKIVLHTPTGASGTNNLNAPVTLHAEIHSSPFQSQSPAPQENETYQEQNGGGIDYPERFPVENCVEANEPVCLSTHSTGSKFGETLPFNHQPRLSHVLPSRTSIRSSRIAPHDIDVPLPTINQDHYCLPTERQNSPMDLEDVYSYDGDEMKSYMSLLPLRRYSEERGTVFSSPQGYRPPLTPPVVDDSNVKYRNEHSGPYFKRHVDGLTLGHAQVRNCTGHNERSKSRSSCTSAQPSSLKLKSLMVHRHQTQHIMSR